MYLSLTNKGFNLNKTQGWKSTKVKQQENKSQSLMAACLLPDSGKTHLSKTKTHYDIKYQTQIF